MVANNTVNQGRRFLMDQSVVAMIWASNGGVNRVLVYDPRGSAMLKCFLMAAYRICPGDAVVPPTDLPISSWLSGALPRFP